MKIKFVNRCELEPIKADEVTLDMPYVAIDDGKEMKYFLVRSDESFEAGFELGKQESFNETGGVEVKGK